MDKKIISSKKKKPENYSIYLPIKNRKQFSIDMSGNGDLDLLQAKESEIYKKFMEKCHKKTPNSFLFLGRRDTIFVYADCKHIIKKSIDDIKNKYNKTININRVVIADIEKSVISSNLNLHKPEYKKIWIDKDNNEIIFNNFPAEMIIN